MQPPTDVAALINEAMHAEEIAREAALEAAAARRAAVLALAQRGYPTRDIGALLGLSHQWISQLLTDSA